MEYIFQNIGNLQKASITVEKEKANIKYGFNGIGKTTIIKAIKCMFYDEADRARLQQQITPLLTGDEPSFPSNLLTDYSDVKVYDRSYFEKLFKKTDLLNDTYSLVIEDDDYCALLEIIKDKINIISESIESTGIVQEINPILTTLQSKPLLKYKEGTRKPVKKDSVFYYYSSRGVSINSSVSTKYHSYNSFIDSPYRVAWNKWIAEADFNWFSSIKRCPFCGRLDEKIVDKIDSLNSLKNKPIYVSYDGEQKIILTISKYLSNPLSDEVLQINNLKKKTNKTILKPIKNGIQIIGREMEKIKSLLSINAMLCSEKLKNNHFQSFLNQLKSYKLSNKLSLKDSNGIDMVKQINSAIDEMVNSLSAAKKHIGNIYKNVQAKIKANDDLINNFMEIAGLPYRITTKQQDDKYFSTDMSYVNDANVIDNQLDYLSYGEANALALLLFCIEAKKCDGKTLIVFDDPVSSFDNNKRYAIYDYIFNNSDNKKKLLWKKTVLLFTHEFETVLVFCRAFPLYKQDIANFAYLSLEEKELVEKPFKNSDINSSLETYKSLAEDGNLCKIARVVAARHCVEISGHKDSTEYNLLSSHIHRAPTPYKYEDLKHEIKRFLLPNEISSAETELKKLFGSDYNYSDYSLEINSDTYLKTEYNKKNATKFEKVCITRCYLQTIQNKDIKSYVKWNFLSNAFHVESDTIHSIKGYNILDVPDYIIALCDETMNG